MKGSRGTSSLLSKYTLIYEKNPRSRVFAPLAEVYRKLGMLDQSFKILKEGIKYHPSYTLGYIVLAKCYFDKNNFEMSYNTIRPFVSQSLENISLQKLFGEVCLKLGHQEEALQTYKYLLLLNGSDKKVAAIVKDLEDNFMLKEEEILESKDKSIEDDIDENQWVQVNFNKSKELEDVEDEY